MFQQALAFPLDSRPPCLHGEPAGVSLSTLDCQHTPHLSQPPCPETSSPPMLLFPGKADTRPLVTQVRTWESTSTPPSHAFASARPPSDPPSNPRESMPRFLSSHQPGLSQEEPNTPHPGTAALPSSLLCGKGVYFVQSNLYLGATSCIKCRQIICIQLNELSHSEHPPKTSTQIKKHSTPSMPRGPQGDSSGP